RAVASRGPTTAEPSTAESSTADAVRQGAVMSQVKPSELYTAARLADALVYAVGVAGVVGGGLLFQQDRLGLALVAWALTFCVGAGLRLVAWATKGVAQMLQRSDTIIEELARLSDEQRRATPSSEPGAQGPSSQRSFPPGERPRDPYQRWGGWH
ncbi:MAG: hypothetical protein BRC31_08155, partial [Actinobacteria bacterium QS_5_72_10]